MGTKGCRVLGQEGVIKELEGLFGINSEVLGFLDVCALWPT